MNFIHYSFFFAPYQQHFIHYFNTMPSVYIHVPFCQKRCHYCSFYSTTYGSEERRRYVDALVREMQARPSDSPVDTLYFGGGTPSQLDADNLDTIFHALRNTYTLTSDAEITFECNPDDIINHDGTATALPHLLHYHGVNRVSMGIQSFSDDILHTINRRHTANQALLAIDALHDAGIHNISIDLIYGLPGQSLASFESDVRTAVSLASTTAQGSTHPAITHLSSYCLSIEEGTHLYNMRARGIIADPDEELTLAMYNRLVDLLTKAGFLHYEISNFALPGYPSRHNSQYWQGAPYIGLGPGAHSYDGHTCRRWNLPDLHAYCAAPTTTYDEEHLSSSELYDELLLTRLRTSHGLPLHLLTPTQHSYLLRQAAPYLRSGALALTPDGTHLHLTRSGIFISDTIISDLMCYV